MSQFTTTTSIRARGEDTPDDQVDEISLECETDHATLEYYEYVDEKKRTSRRVRLTYAEIDELKKAADEARDIIKLQEGTHYVVQRNR